tara:strand:+ start:3245 stop:4240 length:996 start_codon:yes stop_codon:yes gene_type:complete
LFFVGEHTNIFKLELFLGLMDNYEQLVERISSSSGIEKDEIGRKVEAKRAKLSGLVSKEGAAQIVAAELGINFEQERLKLSELLHGMKRANVVGKILEIYSIREYNKNDRVGKVANLLIADSSSNMKMVLWDTNHIQLFENGKLKKGDVIEVSNGGVRNGELHLSSFSDIKKSDEKLDNVVEERVFGEKKLKDVKPGESVKVRAVIVQSFEPRYFEVSEKTGRKVSDEEREKGEVKIVKRALLNVVLDDGTESMRSVMFGDTIKKLGLQDEEIFDLAKFEAKKLSLLGEEKIFSGNVRQNALYNTIEFTIEDVKEINADELVKELEAKSSG